MVYATGYNIELPFLAGVYSAEHNKMPLYLRVVPPDLPGLYFIGFIQTVGSGIPLTEYQSQWVGDLITGAIPMPSHDDMTKWIAHDQKEMGKRYLRSERHTMQVDYWRYIRAIGAERRRRPGGVEASLVHAAGAVVGGAGAVVGGAAGRLRGLLPAVAPAGAVRMPDLPRFRIRRPLARKNCLASVKITQEAGCAHVPPTPLVGGRAGLGARRADAGADRVRRGTGSPCRGGRPGHQSDQGGADPDPRG